MVGSYVLDGREMGNAGKGARPPKGERERRDGGSREIPRRICIACTPRSEVDPERNTNQTRDSSWDAVLLETERHARYANQWSRDASRPTTNQLSPISVGQAGRWTQQGDETHGRCTTTSGNHGRMHERLGPNASFKRINAKRTREKKHESMDDVALWTPSLPPKHGPGCLHTASHSW
ncbi:hypothetical protein VTK73DRAFT_2620 [Phialemonium thermophilum]|uniref:Uncharacterized protein n=1 Tax=Phialemonium thermophilum TaxID=223376 RepID=A0ABR3VR37_9PEZI